MTFCGYIIQEIPVLGTFLKMARALKSIPNILFARKVQSFLGAVNSNPEIKEKVLRKVITSEEERRQAGEAVLFSLERADSLEKASIIGWMYSKYLIGELDLNLFRRLARAVDFAFVDDLRNFGFLRRARTRGHGAADFSNLIGTGLVELAPDPPLPTANTLQGLLAVQSRPPTQEYIGSKLGGHFVNAMRGYSEAKKQEVPL